jgi:hypothetical protein
MSFDPAELAKDNPIRDYLADQMRRYAEAAIRAQNLRAEFRLRDFLLRNRLPLNEVEMVYFQQTGESYPQWKGAIDLLPVVSAPED